MVTGAEAEEEDAHDDSEEESTEATREDEEAPTKSIYDLQPDDE